MVVYYRHALQHVNSTAPMQQIGNWIMKNTLFTNEEFAALARNDDGDIIDLAMHFMFLKEGQIKRLTGDDFSRVDDYREEARCLLADYLGT